MTVMHPMKLRVLAVISVVTCSAITTARADLRIDETVYRSEAWTIGYNSSLKGCVASATAEDGTTVWIGFNGIAPDTPAYLAFTNPNWRFIEPRKFYEVEIRAAGFSRRTGYASGVERPNEKGLFVFGVKWRLLEEFGAGSGLVLSVSKGEPSLINVSGASNAIEKLLSCQQHRNVALKPRGVELPRLRGVELPRLPEETQFSKSERLGADGENLPRREPEQSSAVEQSTELLVKPRNKSPIEESGSGVPTIHHPQQQPERQNTDRERSESGGGKQVGLEPLRSEESDASARDGFKASAKPQAEPVGGGRDAKSADDTHQVASPTELDKTVAMVPTLPSQPAIDSGLSGGALIKAIKQELMRVGCYDGRIDEDWQTSAARASVQKYGRLARLAISPVEPTAELLDSIRTKSGRVCPVECGQGKVDKNGRCVTEACPLGLIRDGDGDCVVRRRPVMQHEVEVKERRPRAWFHEARRQGRQVERSPDDDKLATRRRR